MSGRLPGRSEKDGHRVRVQAGSGRRGRKIFIQNKQIYISFNCVTIENNIYWIGLVSMVIFGFISHFIIIYAIQLSNLSFVTNFQYSQLLWSTIINFLIFGVPADISKIVGLIGIIIFGVLFIRVEGTKKVKKIN